YLPPLGNPPSKLPLLTLLKQARAFGVGVVLATQNPVDLDYKALSNIGTWFIGRLQTERDKARLLDGLESAAAGAQFNRAQIEKILSSLGNRVFLLNNVHEDSPELMQTRWALSYLRGPLTRDQIKTLMDPVRNAAPAPAPVAQASAAAPAASTPPPAAPAASAPPALPPDVTAYYLPARRAQPGASLLYEPALFGAAKVVFADARTKISETRTLVFHTPITNSAIPVQWENAEPLDVPLTDLEKSPRPGAQFGELPSPASQSRNYPAWGRDFAAWLYTTQSLNLMRSPSLGEVSQPGEDERDFRIRLSQRAREKRDEMTEALRKKYAPKFTSLQERLRRAMANKEKQEAQARQAQLQTALSVGATLLSAFTGRKSSAIGKASSAARQAGRVMQEGKDVSLAEETVESIQQQIKDLEAQFNAEVAALSGRVDPLTETLEMLAIRPKKTDITVQLLALVWMPYLQDAYGNLTPAW
ncbi:MAG: hypothetical protein WHV44_01835, partial [Anaerolineales bacterium]